ncbi:hypothetical protein [Streptomyces wuyuanensis]|uniref:hypothetical protein n=1 Tax=Streptomyces wuyuanensis TaxID=1196353 RepID=UPI0037919F8C
MTETLAQKDARLRAEHRGRALAEHQPGRRFFLLRHHDITGVSGTGVVADGVEWPDGTVTIRWRGERPSTVDWGSIDDALHIHGHSGSTEIVWVDPEQPAVPEQREREA